MSFSCLYNATGESRAACPRWTFWSCSKAQVQIWMGLQLNILLWAEHQCRPTWPVCSQGQFHKMGRPRLACYQQLNFQNKKAIQYNFTGTKRQLLQHKRCNLKESMFNEYQLTTKRQVSGLNKVCSSASSNTASPQYNRSLILLLQCSLPSRVGPWLPLNEH